MANVKTYDWHVDTYYVLKDNCTYVEHKKYSQKKNKQCEDMKRY